MCVTRVPVAVGRYIRQEIANVEHASELVYIITRTAPRNALYVKPTDISIQRAQ